MATSIFSEPLVGAWGAQLDTLVANGPLCVFANLKQQGIGEENPFVTGYLLEVSAPLKRCHPNQVK